MELKGQRRLAAKIMKCGESRVWFDPARLGDIAQAITAEDVRKLIGDSIIRRLQKKGVSKGRVRAMAEQKRKGRRKGKGSRKGGFASRFHRKAAWISRIRAQRKLAKELLVSGKINKPAYKNVYRMAGGGFFRSRAHLLEYAGVKPEQLQKIQQVQKPAEQEKEEGAGKG